MFVYITNEICGQLSLYHCSSNVVMRAVVCRLSLNRLVEFDKQLSNQISLYTVTKCRVTSPNDIKKRNDDMTQNINYLSIHLGQTNFDIKNSNWIPVTFMHREGTRYELVGTCLRTNWRAFLRSVLRTK